MTTSIDINCDVGEVSFENDAALLPFVSSCNVCCGAHAGDPVLITSTIREAVRQGVAVGAHPSYPDAANFGRVSMQMPLNEFSDHLRFQIATVKAIVESFGGKLQHVKPHGALYHDVIERQDLAKMLLDVIAEIDPQLFVMGQADSEFAVTCRDRQQAFIHEAFADRRYANQTSLVSRRLASSVIDCEADFDEQIQNLLAGRIQDSTGNVHKLTVQSICLHGDSEHAIPFANRIQQLFQEAGVKGKAISEIDA